MQEPKLEQTKKVALRTCHDCGIQAFTTVDLELFQPNKHSLYDRYNWCRKCWALHRKPLCAKYYATHKESISLYIHNHRRDEYYTTYRENHRKEISAKNKAKKIPLKDNCERCGKTNVYLIRHHPNYDKALEVVTLCSRCHKEVHKL